MRESTPIDHISNWSTEREGVKVARLDPLLVRLRPGLRRMGLALEMISPFTP